MHTLGGAGPNLLQQASDDVSVQSPLVCLIKNDDTALEGEGRRGLKCHMEGGGGGGWSVTWKEGGGGGGGTGTCTY